MVEPNGVLDDGHRKTVAVRLGVGHGASAYPNPIKATQPLKLLEEGQIDPQIAQVLPLSQAAQAQELLEGAKVVGKIILHP